MTATFLEAKRLDLRLPLPPAKAGRASAFI